MHLSRTPKNKMYLQVESLRSAVAASGVVYPQMEGFIWAYYPQFNLDEHHCEVWRVSLWLTSCDGRQKSQESFGLIFA